jgi:hypothetical protein
MMASKRSLLLLLTGASLLASWQNPLQAQTSAAPAAQGAPDQADDAAIPGTGQGTLFPDNGTAQALQNRRRPSRLLGNKSARNARAADLLATEADADPLEVRVAFRRAKTEAILRDPGLIDLELEASAAPTDRAKRAYLRQYYERLFAAVAKIDPSPEEAAHLKLLRLIARQRYDPQRRMLAGEEGLLSGRGGGRR